MKPNSLSLKQYCIPCKSKCCYHFGGIGSPILDKKEKQVIESFVKKNFPEKADFFERQEFMGEEFFILKEDSKKKCVFLEKNDCLIQEVKPIDCLAYPIKLIPDKVRGEKVIVDLDCPAAEHLPKKFIEKSKILAVKDFKRFRKETFEYWLKNFVKWPFSEKVKEI